MPVPHKQTGDLTSSLAYLSDSLYSLQHSTEALLVVSTEGSAQNRSSKAKCGHKCLYVEKALGQGAGGRFPALP